MKRIQLLTGILLTQVAFAAYVAMFLLENGYLPSPFIYDKNDTFMDLYHTVYWSFRDGMYGEWKSVYPPLNFLLLQPLQFWVENAQALETAFDLRDEASWIYGTLIGVYLLIPMFVLRSHVWAGWNNVEKTVAYGCMILSLPMLFALERGNLILLALLALPFALEDSSGRRIVAISVLINIKPYFALFSLAYLAKRDINGFLQVVFCAGLIFLVSGMIVSEEFLLFFTNLFDYSQIEGLQSPREVMALPSSVSAYAFLLKTESFLSSSYARILGFDPDSIISVIEISKWAAVAFALQVMFAHGQNIAFEKLICLVVIVISNLGVWVGGYTFILYAPIIPILLRQPDRAVYVCSLLAIFLPLDIFQIVGDEMGIQPSYLGGGKLPIDWAFGLGGAIRPLANLSMLLALSLNMLQRHGDGLPKRSQTWQTVRR